MNGSQLSQIPAKHRMGFIQEKLAIGLAQLAKGETWQSIETLKPVCDHEFGENEASVGAMAHEAMAKALSAQGLQGASLRAMKTATDLCPTDAALRVRHGIARAYTGDHHAAICEYKVQSNPCYKL